MKHQFHVSGSSASFLSAKNVKHRLGIGSHAQSAQRNSTRNSGSTGAASVSLGWIFFRSNLGLFPSYQEGFVVDFLKDAPGLGKHGVFFSSTKLVQNWQHQLHKHSSEMDRCENLFFRFMRWSGSR